MADIDLDDTTNCPKAATCRGCGTTEDIAVGTVGSPVGVACVTACEECLEVGAVRFGSVVEASNATADHAGHLGIDLDRMAAILAGEQDR